MVFDKVVEEIVAEEIRALVANKQTGSQSLCYKKEFPGGSEDKKELLRHVAGFANTAGGWSLLGIRERRDDNNKPTGSISSRTFLPISCGSNAP